MAYGVVKNVLLLYLRTCFLVSSGVNWNDHTDTLSSFLKELPIWIDDFDVKSEEMRRNGCVRCEILDGNVQNSHARSETGKNY